MGSIDIYAYLTKALSVYFDIRTRTFCLQKRSIDKSGTNQKKNGQINVMTIRETKKTYRFANKSQNLLCGTDRKYDNISV